MRDIKFRAWLPKANTMVYEIEKDDDLADIIADKGNKYILMQYTGLEDKNGVEIYEGDILEYTFTDYKGKKLWKEKYILKENISGWEMRNITKPRRHRSLSLVKNYEVVGNIYDNPDLLKKS